MQTAGTGNFVGQGAWSTATQLTGDDGRPGDPGISNTGRYRDLQNTDTFNVDGTGSRWKILTDNGLIPNANDGVTSWTTSVDVLFLSSNDENGTAISDYYGQLRAGDLGRLQTDATATPANANIPAFCSVGSVESSPFICDSPAGYVVFTLLSAPVRMTPTGTASDTGGVWRMSIRTDRADTTPTLSTASNVVANFGYNRVVEGADGAIGVTGSRGAGRFDTSITLDDNNAAPAVGSSAYNNNARQTLCAALQGTFTTSCSLAIGNPIAGDVIVITYTSLDGNTVTTRGAIHDGTGVADDDWAAFAIQIDGSLLVQGSVVADALAVNSVTASKLNIVPADIGVGSSSSGTTSRMVITGDRIDIYEGNTLRVRLGRL